MFNLVKMDVYRILRSRALKLGVFAALIVCSLSMLLALGIIELFKYALQYEPETAGEMMIFPMVGWYEGADIAEMVLYGTNSFALFIGCMITASFVGAEQSCGYVKNLAGQISNRGYTVVSKFIAAAFAQLIILLVYLATAFAFAFIAFGSYIESYSIGSLLGCLGLRFLLYLAVNSVIIFLCTLTKSHALAMVTGAILGSGITRIVYFVVNLLLPIMKIDLNVSHYMPDGINGILTLSSMPDLVWRALAVSLLFIVGFISLAALMFKKRDVR